GVATHQSLDLFSRLWTSFLRKHGPPLLGYFRLRPSRFGLSRQPRRGNPGDFADVVANALEVGGAEASGSAYHLRPRGSAPPLATPGRGFQSVSRRDCG